MELFFCLAFVPRVPSEESQTLRFSETWRTGQIAFQLQ